MALLGTEVDCLGVRSTAQWRRWCPATEMSAPESGSAVIVGLHDDI